MEMIVRKYKKSYEIVNFKNALRTLEIASKNNLHSFLTQDKFDALFNSTHISFNLGLITSNESSVYFENRIKLLKILESLPEGKQEEFINGLVNSSASPRIQASVLSTISKHTKNQKIKSHTQKALEQFSKSWYHGEYEGKSYFSIGPDLIDKFLTKSHLADIKKIIAEKSPYQHTSKSTF